MQYAIDLRTEVQENGDMVIQATASIDSDFKLARVRHVISAYELHRSYNRQKLIDEIEARTMSAALAKLKSKNSN